MKRRILLQALALALAAGLWGGAASIAEAHGGPPRVEVGAGNISPGATLEIRGINIAPEQHVTLTLVGPSADLPLGVALGDVHGDFTQLYALPATLAPGAYSVRAIGENRVIVGVPLTITGGASDAEAGGQRDSDEPLLAAPAPPLPADPGDTEQPQVTPALASAPTSAIAADDRSVQIDSSMQLAIGVVVAVLIVVGLAVGLRRRLANAG